MSAVLALAHPESPLGELAVTANDETRCAFEAGTSMIQHAINAGDALLAAKAQVPRGEWQDWLVANFERSVAVATQCMRIARHKQAVIEGQATNFRGALRLLHGQTPSNFDPNMAEEVRDLRTQGLTYGEIAERTGVGKSTVFRWCNPEAEKRRRAKAHQQTIAGRRALNRQNRDAAAASAGGSIAEAYSLVRKALQALERAREVERHGPEVKRHISDAMNRIYNAEDAIVKASKLS